MECGPVLAHGAKYELEIQSGDSRIGTRIQVIPAMQYAGGFVLALWAERLGEADGDRPDSNLGRYAGEQYSGG